MGNSYSVEPADVMEVVCASRPELAGYYQLVFDEDEVVITKEAGKFTGIELDTETLTLNKIVEDSPAAKDAKLAGFIGKTLVSVNGKPASMPGVLQGTAAETTLTLKFRNKYREANGLPFWKRGEMRLYSTYGGKWMITDKGEAGMAKNAGTLMTGNHSGHLPGEGMPWMTFDKQNGVWRVDPTITVIEVDEPQFKEGQLVEAKLEKEPCSQFRQAIIRQARPVRDILRDNIFQYAIEFSDGSYHNNIPIGCVRKHTAYRKDAPKAEDATVTSPPTEEIKDGPRPAITYSPAEIAEAIASRPLEEILASYSKFRSNFELVSPERQEELRNQWADRKEGLKFILPVLVNCASQENFQPLLPQHQAIVDSNRRTREAKRSTVTASPSQSKSTLDMI